MIGLSGPETKPPPHQGRTEGADYSAFSAKSDENSPLTNDSGKEPAALGSFQRGKSSERLGSMTDGQRKEWPTTKASVSLARTLPERSEPLR